MQNLISNFNEIVTGIEQKQKYVRSINKQYANCMDKSDSSYTSDITDALIKSIRLDESSLIDLIVLIKYHNIDTSCLVNVQHYVYNSNNLSRMVINFAKLHNIRHKKLTIHAMAELIIRTLYNKNKFTDLDIELSPFRLFTKILYNKIVHILENYNTRRKIVHIDKIHFYYSTNNYVIDELINCQNNNLND